MTKKTAAQIITTSMVVTPPSEKELKIRAASVNVVEQCKRAVIDSEDSMSAAADLGKFAKLQITNLEEERKKIVSPLNDVVKHVNARFKAVTEPLNDAMELLRGKVSDYQREMRAIAAKEQREREEAARKEAKEMAAIGDLEGAKEIVTIAEQVKEVKPAARGNYGSVSTARRLVVTVDDADKIPRMFLVPDMTAITNAVRYGIAVPGVSSKYEENAVFR